MIDGRHVRRWARCATLLFAVAALPASSPGQFSGSEQPAAILVFPFVRLDRANGVDTLLRLANTTDQPVDVH